MRHVLALSVTVGALLFACAGDDDAVQVPPPAAPAVDGGGSGGPLGLRAFVTSATYTGDLVTAAGGDTDGQAAGDALCTTAAKGAGLTGVWVAYLSSAGGSANEHVVDDGPFFAVDGTTKLFESKLGVGGGALVEIRDEKGGEPLDTSGSVDKFGNVSSSVGTATFWTGSSAAGEIAETCRAWTSKALSDTANHASHRGAETTYVLSCQDERHLLCFEQREARAGRATKRVFITSETFDGNLGGLAGADKKCAAAAKAGGLDGKYVAWLSGRDGDKAVRAADRVTEARYVLLDRTPVFEAKSQLETGPSVPINITELGSELTSVMNQAWTGTLKTGAPAPDGTCADWTSAAGVDSGAIGDVENPETWSARGIGALENCDDLFHLYCFEQ